MHAPQPWFIPSSTARPSRRSTHRAAAGPWLTEHRLLQILDGVVLAVLLATFVLA
jgi:hypothetical protein